MIQSYRDLDVWQRAMDFAVELYSITKAFPSSEVYGLTSQMRRAAVSIPSNIAEGRSRKSTPEFSKFLTIAYGSLAEIQTQIEPAARLQYVDVKKPQVCWNARTKWAAC